MKADECPDYTIDRGQQTTYRSACNKLITTEGKRTLATRAGGFLRAEVADVSKNLLCVAELLDSGHRVVFDSQEGYKAVHKRTGRAMHFERVGKVFNVGVDILPYGEGPLGFPGRGARP